MSTLPSLNELATLATATDDPDAALRRALAIAGEGAGGVAFLTYGVVDGFDYVSDGVELELSRTAIWLINRDLTSHEGMRCFAGRHGRVVNFHSAASRAPAGYVAVVIPAAGTTATMLIIKGDWPRGLSARQRQFISAALPSLSLLFARRFAQAAAAQEQAQLDTLVAISRVISETEDLETMLTSVAKTVAQLTSIDYVSIDILSDDNTLRMRCVNYQLPPTVDGDDRWRRAMNRPDALRNIVVVTRQPLIFEDAQNDERIPENARAFFSSRLIRSTAIFPLVAKDETLGVLSIAAVRPTSFGGKQREMLEGLAGQIAAAVVGVQLYEQRRAAEEALTREQTLLAATIETTTDGILVVDREGRVAYANRRFIEMWRIPEGLAQSRNDERMLAHVLDQLADPDEFLAKVQQLYQSQERSEDSLYFKDGRIFERFSRPLVQDGESAGRVWSFRDVTESRRAEQLLLQQARHDSLTNLLNHAAITETLESMAREFRSIGIAVVDVDGMKAVNDTYGHQVGDQVLLAVADALSRDGAIVGRYGGDEFLVVLPDRERPDAEAYCRAVLDEMARRRVTDPETASSVPVVASMGLAMFPVEASTIDDAIRLADNAMYTEKRERITLDSGASVRAVLGDERAAKMIGEVVPLLTAQGELPDKLRLVAHHLSVGAGYDVVRFDVNEVIGGAQAAVHPQPTPATGGSWILTRSDPFGQRLARTLNDSRRPLLIEDLLREPELTDAQRERLLENGIQSILMVPMVWQDQVIGALSVASKRAGSLDARDARFLTSIANQLTAIIQMEVLVDDLEAATSHLNDARTETVILLAAAAEAHDHTTGRHLQRVRVITEMLARELGYGDDKTEALGLAAVLHDIGKIRVPDAILLSPARLNGDEWDIMKRHTTWGAEFLSERPGFELAATIAGAHHERWDGTGYPRGLAAEEIPEVAQIVSVADSLDAITSDRPYRAGRALEVAIDEITRCAGRQFSPRVVEALVSLYRRGALAFPFDDQLRRAA